MVTVRQRKAISEGDIALRDTLYPDAKKRLWDRMAAQGFVTVPKTMPFICRILDEMSKNFPLADTYRVLWTYTWNNNAFVKLGNLSEIAYAAGFQGQRGERTLRDRLTRLAELGFLELKPYGSSQLGFAFIPNPHEVLLTHYARWQDASAAERAKLPQIREESINAFLARAVEVKAVDVREIQERILAEREARNNPAPAPEASEPPATLKTKSTKVKIKPAPRSRVRPRT